jgi:hypothetical protein
MPIAFKEWAVTVRALAEGEQLVTLRKGGIREPEKHFSLDHDRFFLYPTFDHQRGDLVRESHQPELRRALEEGVWPDGDPPAHALTRDGGIAQPDRVRIRAWAEVARSWTVTDRRDDYGGCRSWLEITRDLPFEGTPVLSDEEFDRASEEIAGIVHGDGALAYA